jgi:hypothetical protein
VAALVLGPAAVHAQSYRDLVAYSALVNTPVGALPPSSYGADVAAAPPSVELLYGRIEFGSTGFDNVGVGYGRSFGRTRVGVLAGALTCRGCDGVVVARLDAEILLRRHAAEEGGQFAIAVQPGRGYGHVLDDDAPGDALSATLGIPVSYTVGSTWRVIMFATPGVGFGRITGENSGWRPMAGAGVRVRGPSGLGAVLGVQQVMIENAGEMLAGLGITLPAGRRPK